MEILQENHVPNISSTEKLEKPVLAVVLPAYNEAEVIKGVVTDFYEEIVTKIPSRLIIAEDGSVDDTPKILASLANQLPMRLFLDRRRKGYAMGVADALRKCDQEWVFFSDSDGQYLPADFWRLWENRFGYDMIIGRKLHRSESVHRTILAKGFHNIANRLFSLDFHDADCGFRLIKRSLIDSIIDSVQFLKYSFWAEFTIRASLKGYKIAEVPINHAMRLHGNTQIYAPSKIPMIVLKQLKGLAELYFDTIKSC